MSNKAFEKFIKNEPKGAAKKEAIKQQKRKAKKAAREKGNLARKIKTENERGFNHSFEANSFKPKAKRNFTEPKLNNVAYRREVQELKNWTPDSMNQTSPKSTSFDKPKKKFEGTFSKKPSFKKEENKFERKEFKKDFSSTPTSKTFFAQKNVEEKMPLNKFVAHCGVCGRREAAELIKQGIVAVNGKIITEPGYKLLGNEDVKLNGKRIFVQKNLVYILLNKPKDYITTTKDPEGRKTVFDLLGNATNERIYPVGRLDRNTTGVLLLTNDGELAQKLTHPSFQIKKVYEVKLDKPVTKKDMDAIVSGITLEDGFIQADSIAYTNANDKSIVGIEIHSGKNRIVRRIFEHLTYDVKNLDRVMFANLTKKNIERGRYRFLSEKEVRLLKYMNQSFVKKADKKGAL